MSRRIPVELQPVSDDVREDFARLRGFQRQIEARGRLCALVAQEASDQFVFAGTVLEDQGTGGMPELMHSDPKPGQLLDPVDDLGAE
jgi:hypothetical protein